MEDNKKRKYMYIVGPLVLLIALVGITYAFFNYTRTGVSNTIKVGKISFSSNQTDTIILTNVFPISSSEATGENTNYDEVVISINGDTTYSEGIEYLITATDVINTINNKEIPISIEVTASIGLGNNDLNYFDNRGGNDSINKVLAKDTIEENGDIMVGYIAKGATGVNGTVTIKAYIDKNKIAISDTYPSGDVTHTESSGEASIEVVDYTNETTTNWVNGRVVLTTSEWNTLQNSSLSFKVKVEANEGIWVSGPICKRATQLHSENCTTSYCANDGYTDVNSTIYYGNLGTTGSKPVVGDAFDCDVTGDGNYTERFYYVSDYYDTENELFDSSTAVLIYYTNVDNGESSTYTNSYASFLDTQSLGYTCNDNQWGCNWYGPLTAANQLPTTQSWKNVSLKTSSRIITACFDNNCTTSYASTDTGNNQINNPFDYSGKSARLLTLQELKHSECDILSGKNALSDTGSLASCNFFFENTKYSDESRSSWAIYLENPAYTDSMRAYEIDIVSYVSAASVQPNYGGRGSIGVRPVIEIPYSKIDY